VVRRCNQAITIPYIRYVLMAGYNSELFTLGNWQVSGQRTTGANG